MNERTRQPQVQEATVRRFTATRLNRLVLALILILVASLPVHGQSLTDSNLTQITFDQKLNTQVALDLPFRDETGRRVQLREYFGNKPVVLVLGYYQCPMLCTLILNGMVETMENLKWSIGNQFEVVNVSIDPHETVALAAAKKKSYLKRYGRSGAANGWHFLTGDEAAIRQLADEVGFHYAYDPASKEYAHPSGLVILTPSGKVSHYLFGVTFDAKDLFNALSSASAEKVGSPIQRLVLLCFHYNPITGKYGAAIMLTIRILAVATLLGIASLIFYLSRSRKKKIATGSAGEARGDEALSASGQVSESPARAFHDP